MKKTFLVFLVFMLIGTLTIGGLTINVLAEEDSEATGLGLSINAVTSEYLDTSSFREGSPIFNENWLDTQIQNGNQLTVATTNINSVSKGSFKEIMEEIKFDFNYEANLGIQIFTANISNGFSGGINYENYVSQYYYNLKSESVRYTYSLPNYSSNLDNYKANLHPDFVNAVGNFFAGTITPAYFFQTYGTHVLMKGIYGGRLELYYSVASNQNAVGGSLAENIDQALKANVLDKLGGDGSISFNLHSAIDIDKGSYSESTRIKARGGNTFTAFSLGGSFASDYKSWANSVDTSPALIGATTDGLIPLWMFLPEQYDTPENIEKMKETFKSYATAYKNGLLVGHDAKDSYSTGYISVRTAEKKVTDSGRFKQHHDDLDLNDKFPYAIDVMKEYGYDKMKVEIQLKARRVDKGYFYVFLYKSLNDNKDSQSIADMYFTLEAKGVVYDKSFSFDNLSTDLFASEGCLIIRYGAKGTSQDDWYNSDVNVNITYTKQ